MTHRKYFTHRSGAAVVAGLVAGMLPLTAGIADAQDAEPTVALSEIRIDQPSVDNDEYFELAGTPGTSLDGLTYVVIGDGSGGSGVVEAVVDLTGQVIPASGYFVAAEATSTLGTADLTTNLNFENGDNVTHLLVDGFTGANGDDLDTDDDGTLDATPWTVVQDCAALLQSTTSGDATYCATTVGPDGSFVPAHAFVCESGWTIGEFDTLDQDTPGAANACQPDDGDGGDGDGDGEPGALAALVINEVDYDQAGTDAAEFVEIKNNDTVAVDLAGYQLVFVNGANDTMYRTLELSGTIDAGGYFVVCANAANTPECDLDDSPDTNYIQNGDPDALAITSGATIVDAVSYEGDVPGYVETAGAPADSAESFEGISRFPDGVDTNDNSADFSVRCITPGAANSADTANCPDPNAGSGGGDVEIGVCGDPATLISTVQGSGAISPIVGTSVVVEGVVVGDFQNNDGVDDGQLDGFHVQEEVVDQDGNPMTSEGVFVFGVAMPDVTVGNLVRVAGTVAEFESSGGSSQTQIGSVSAVLICDPLAEVPPATDVTLPLADPDALESFEGMLVNFPQDLVISEYFNFDRFGEIVLALPVDGQDRPFQPTAVFEPGSPEAAALALYNESSRVTLDDGISSQNPDFVRHPNGEEFTLANRFRGGDLVANATGVIDDTFGLYRIQPTEGADYTAENPRPAAPEDVGGDLTVASFNVLNYFLSIDEGPDVCGPAGNLDCRGADSQEEFDRQRAKILAALGVIDADVFGLIEMENTTGVEPLADLVEGLNATAGAGTYDFIDTGTIGTDAIRVGIIYKPGSVTPLGDFAILDSSVDPRFVDDKNRPVLAQSFTQNSDGAVFTVAVNHLKSKGSDCDDLGDPDLGDGAGNCNLTRLAAAEALVDWLATDPTGSDDPDMLLIGDLNSYDKEDPIDAIIAGPDDVVGTDDDYTDLNALFGGELAYSYLFGGQFGYLDYAMSNATLTPQVTGATAWHINADEPDILDYDTSFKSPAQVALFEEDSYRSSDHDPVIVGLDLNVAPVCTAAVANRTSIWPPNGKFVDIDVLGVTDIDGDDVTITITGITQDEAVDARGSGNTAPDGQGVGTSTAQVRAERVATGNGRVYHVTFTASDGLGDTCTGEVTVGVGKSKNKPAVDDGALFDSTVAQAERISPAAGRNR